MNTRSMRYLRDALDEAYELQLDLAGLDFETYQRSRQLQRIAERSLEIIGEALRRALVVDDDLRANNAELREWVALRNILSHQYDNILPEAIWDSATVDVTTLVTELEKLLETPDQG